jgi:transcriptional regulator with XRE-family HTH domain
MVNFAPATLGWGVSDIERGARNPTIQIVEKLAKPFKVAPGSLLD